jgi:hypothetical protein
MSIFEALMILSFGAAWPASIYRSYTSRSTKGKSLAFLIIIWIGYLSGILHKVFYTYDIIIILYVLNLIMVSADLALYFRNRKLEERVSSAGA